MAPAGLIFLAGAPRQSTLDWENSHLLDRFGEPFCRFLGHAPGREMSPASDGQENTAPPFPVWRSVSLVKMHLPTGHSQNHGSNDATFFTLSALGSRVEGASLAPSHMPQSASMESTDQVLSQFYEESYAKHNDVMSSQLAALSDTGISFHSSQVSWNTSHSSSRLLTDDNLRSKDIPLAGNLHDLKDVPNASYINSIHPQTMTVNLIVGVISIQLPRTVRTRHGTEVQLIEILAGDETKSGFGISFWVPGPQSAEGDMKRMLTALRPQDIVLMQNIALSSFRGKVYGQSLRRDLTRVHLLYRTKMDRTDSGGCYSASDLASARELGSQASNQVHKTAKVRDWCLKFIGTLDLRSDTNRRHGLETKDTLPPDTQ